MKTLIELLKWLGRTALLVTIVTTFQIDLRLGFLGFLAYLAFIWFYHKFDECSRDIADLKRRLKELEKSAPPLHDPYDDVPNLTDPHKPTTPTGGRAVHVYPRGVNLNEFSINAKRKEMKG